MCHDHDILENLASYKALMEIIGDKKILDARICAEAVDKGMTDDAEIPDVRLCLKQIEHEVSLDISHAEMIRTLEDRFSQAPPVEVFVIGGGHGSGVIIRVLKDMNLWAVTGANVRDEGGHSFELSQELNSLLDIWPVMMGDQMNGLLGGFASPGKRQVLNRRICSDVEDDFDISKLSVEQEVIRVFQETIKHPDVPDENLCNNPDFIQFAVFLLTVAREIDENWVRPGHVDVRDASLQNLIHAGVMYMVGAYRKENIDPRLYLVGSHLLEKALGIEAPYPINLVPASFRRNRLMTLHANGKEMIGGINELTNRNPAIRREMMRDEYACEENNSCETTMPLSETSVACDSPRIDIHQEMMRLDPNKVRVIQTRLEDDFEAANEQFLNYINETEGMVIIAPGNFHESILPNLLTDRVVTNFIRARERNVPVVFVMNIVNLAFDWGYEARDYIEAIEDVASHTTGRQVVVEEMISHILVNKPTVELQNFLEDNSEPPHRIPRGVVCLSDEGYKQHLMDRGINVIEAEFEEIIEQKQRGAIIRTPRHSSSKLKAVLAEIHQQNIQERFDAWTRKWNVNPDEPQAWTDFHRRYFIGRPSKSLRKALNTLRMLQTAKSYPELLSTMPNNFEAYAVVPINFPTRLLCKLMRKGVYNFAQATRTNNDEENLIKIISSEYNLSPDKDELFLRKAFSLKFLRKVEGYERKT